MMQEKLLINDSKSNNSEVVRNKQIDEMAEMLDIIAEARETYANDVTDHTENEYIREGFLNADYCKQKKGEWVDQYNGKYANPIYVCSICGKGTLLTPYINELNNMEMTQALSAFCPNCGAKMKGGE